MTRAYELKRRAAHMAETRARIVEAAIELHQTIGPARTSVSAIAEKAGVQRQTYYRHFPDQRSLFQACSGLYVARNPLPDPDAWRAIADPHVRLRQGLRELYAYYADNEPMLSNVTRDAEIDPLTREAVDTNVAPALAELRTTLAEGLYGGAPSSRQLAALDLAIAFDTWHLFTQEHGLSQDEAAALAADVLCCAG